jgi:outer membrane protein OmpA-like peptidoglycan-associated protein
MKNTLKTLMLTAAAVAICGGTAHADPTDKGNYVSFGAGWNYQQNNVFKSGLGRDQTDFDSGYVGTVAIGHAWGQNMRTELEGSYRHNDISSIKGTGATGGSGDFHSWNAMVNEYYDFHNRTNWTPYVGAGVGASFQSAHHIGNAFAPGTTIDDTDTEFAYQGIAGVDYWTTQHSAWGVRYNYFGTTRGKFDTDSAAAGGARGLDENNHAVLVTYRFNWGNEPAPQAEPRAMSEMPPPAAAPAPQPVAYAVPSEQQIEDSPYKIFFANDKYTLTNNGLQVVHDAATAAGSQHAVVLDLTSNTDTTGTPQHNDRLSEERAQAVRKALLAEGVSDKMIHVVSNAERDLPVPTGNHVREPRNRVVTIVLQ